MQTMAKYLVIFRDHHPPIWVTAPSPQRARELALTHTSPLGHTMKIEHVLTAAEE